MYNLVEFGDYLSERELVQENRIPFFVKWVRWYLSSGAGDAEEFSNFLIAYGKAEWQVRQALDALKIFSVWSGDSCFSRKFGSTAEVMKKVLRVRHYALRTEKCYLYWCGKFLSFCESAGLDEKSSGAFQEYLTHLALVKHVAASTQNQAFNALLFLFRHVWGIEPEGIDAVRARKPSRIPEVLSTLEVKAVLDKTRGVAGLVIRLIYSSGIRLCEALSVRFKDVNLSSCSILVRGGKGDKDRVTIMGRNLVTDLSEHMERVAESWQTGGPPVSLPAAIDRKFPAAGQSPAWRYLFPARNPSVSPYTGKLAIHHMHQSTVQREMHRAVKVSGIGKRAGVHTLRHCFATHLLLSGVDLCEIQELLGHKNLETTRVYIHVAKGLRNTVQSPFDMI